MNESPIDPDVALRVQGHVDSERLREAIAALAQFGGRDDGGVSRQTLTEIDLASRRFLIDRALALGCAVEVDECANLFFRRPGSQDLPAVMTGSHGDTQPVGGQLDGAYGVLAGLEVVAALNDADVQTRRPVEVVAWTNEEGSRFGPGCMGSSAYVDPPRLLQYRTSLADCSRSAGRAAPMGLTSGAFHDAMYLAGFCPTAMIFVPSRNGISHNATEATDHADLLLGVKALALAITRLAG